MKAPASSFKSFWKKAYGKGGDENVMVSANTQTDIHTYKKVKNNPPIFVCGNKLNAMKI